MNTPPSLVELVQVHECLRVEARQLKQLSQTLLEKNQNGHDVNQAVDAVVSQFDFLRAVYDSHSKAEDDAIFPALAEKGLPTEVLHDICGEHSGHAIQFNSLATTIKQLRMPLGSSVQVSETKNSLISQLEEQVDKLNSSLFLHLRHEEEELFPFLCTKFTPQELVALVGKIIGDRSSDILCKHLAMVSKDLPADDRARVVDNIREATKGTNFEQWLSSITAQDLSNALESQPSLNPTTSVSGTETLAQTGNTTSECPHYQRNCDVYAKCCQSYYPCRLCHDETAAKRTAVGSGPWHTLNRATIETIRCRLCQVEQPVSNICVNCNTRFGKYYCGICRMFENDENKQIYHCPSCNVCRRGQGLGKDFFHCMKCNACISTSLREHECIDHSLEGNCTICGEDLFTSSKPLSKPKLCGHVMHRECLSQYVTYGYKCPTCRKSIVDMTNTWLELDNTASVLPHPMSIKCCDCQQESNTQVMHGRFSLGKCNLCGSYNTMSMT